jgi:hypothetical protein
MIFAFVEDGTLELYATADEATRAYEGIDVEAGVVQFYDAAGTYLEPEFSARNRRGRLLGWIRWAESGAYRLTACPNGSTDSFGLALHEATSLAPNPWFGSLAQLRAELISRGVVGGPAPEI